MRPVSILSSEESWIHYNGDDSEIQIDLADYCLELQTSFKNSVETVEEVATEIFSFFNQTESNQVIEALNEGVLRFDADTNKFLVNLFTSWIKRNFYDLKEFKRFIVSKEFLGRLILLQQKESEIKVMQYLFYTVFVLAMLSLGALFVFGITFTAPIIILMLLICFGVCGYMGVQWNKKLEVIRDLEKELLYV